MSVTVSVDEDDLLEMFEDRIKFWKTDSEDIELFSKMYERQINEGYYEASFLDIKAIVDNDVVSWCNIIYPRDEIFEEILEHYKNNNYDISELNIGYDYIEAVTDNEDAILVR